jgi:hypothetical protein
VSRLSTAGRVMVSLMGGTRVSSRQAALLPEMQP